MRIATCTKTAVKSDTRNQITARIAQPIEGNELRNGLMRRCTTPTAQGWEWASQASAPPISRAAATAKTTRRMLASVWPR